jgi:hypothetical protein
MASISPRTALADTARPSRPGRSPEPNAGPNPTDEFRQETQLRPNAAFAANRASQPKSRKTTMRKLALLGASALVLALGVASASAIPTTDQIMSHGQVGTVQTYAPNASGVTSQEGRAAAIEAPAADAFIYQPHYGR